MQSNTGSGSILRILLVSLAPESLTRRWLAKTGGNSPLSSCVMRKVECADMLLMGVTMAMVTGG